MSRAIFTANRFHLGDNLIFLNLLRALAKAHVSRAFVHFCNAQDIPQLREAVQDIPNILLEPFESPLWKAHEHEAIDTWKNAEGHWERSPNRWDWAAHTLEHHAWTARRMGFESPFTCREHLLFDYPALEKGDNYAPGYDVLIVNSEPCSGQFGPMQQHGSGYLDGLIEQLFRAGKSIVLTQACDERMVEWAEIDEPRGEIYVLGGASQFTISQIGNLSTRCKNIIGVATGPLWPCINTINHHHHEGRKFITLLSNGEHLNLPHWQQCARVEEVMEIAKQEGWI